MKKLFQYMLCNYILGMECLLKSEMIRTISQHKFIAKVNYPFLIDHERTKLSV